MEAVPFGNVVDGDAVIVVGMGGVNGRIAAASPSDAAAALRRYGMLPNVDAGHIVHRHSPEHDRGKQQRFWVGISLETNESIEIGKELAKAGRYVGGNVFAEILAFGRFAVSQSRRVASSYDDAPPFAEQFESTEGGVDLVAKTEVAGDDDASACFSVGAVDACHGGGVGAMVIGVIVGVVAVSTRSRRRRGVQGEVGMKGVANLQNLGD